VPLGGMMVSRKVFEEKNLALVSLPKKGDYGSTSPYDLVQQGAPLGAEMKSLAEKERLTFKIASIKNKTNYCNLCLFAAGDIHLDYNLLLTYNAPGQAVLTFVHEVTHKFAGTKDEGDNDGYFSFYDRGHRPDLREWQVMMNADSYAWLLYDYFRGDEVKWDR
jgi:hypothetical protein